MARVSTSELEVLLRTFDSKHPGVVLSRGFFWTAAIVDGPRGSTTNEDLVRFFEAIGNVRAVVTDKEGRRGERVGLVVFPNSHKCSAATKQTSANYNSIIKVSSISIDQEFLINAVSRPNRRQPNPKRRVPESVSVLHDGTFIFVLLYRSGRNSVIFMAASIFLPALNPTWGAFQANSAHYVERRKQTAPAPAAPEQEVPAQPYPGVPEEAIELAKKVTMLSIAHCSSVDSKVIAEGLIRLAAVSRPDGFLHKYFSNRAVLLMGIDAGTSEPGLSSGLGSTFGELDLLTVHSEQGVALAVFKTWRASAKLRGQPAETVRRFGVDRCGPIPREVDVATLVTGASDMVHSFGETYRRAVSYEDSRSAFSGTSAGGS